MPNKKYTKEQEVAVKRIWQENYSASKRIETSILEAIWEKIKQDHPEPPLEGSSAHQTMKKWINETRDHQPKQKSATQQKSAEQGGTISSLLECLQEAATTTLAKDNPSLLKDMEKLKADIEEIITKRQEEINALRAELRQKEAEIA